MPHDHGSTETPAIENIASTKTYMHVKTTSGEKRISLPEDAKPWYLARVIVRQFDRSNSFRGWQDLGDCDSC